MFVKLCHCAKTAKAVGGEEDLLGGLIAHHDFRPVHHGRKNEGQRVAAQAQTLAVLDHHAAFLCDGVRTEKLLHILEGLGVAHHLHGRVTCGQLRDVGTVVRLHVGDDEVVGLGAVQGLGQIFQPRVGGAGVYRIQNGGLLIPDDIGIVAHTGGHRVLALEQVDGGIIHTYAQNGLADLFHAHNRHPLFCCIAVPANRKYLLGTFPIVAQGFSFCKPLISLRQRGRLCHCKVR